MAPPRSRIGQAAPLPLRRATLRILHAGSGKDWTIQGTALPDSGCLLRIVLVAGTPIEIQAHSSLVTPNLDTTDSCSK